MRTGKKALLTSISKSVKHLSVFLLSILLARYLSLDDYGLYLQVMLIANMAIYFSIMGIPSSVYYFLGKAQNKKKFLVRTVLIIHSLAIISATIGMLGSDQIALLLNNNRLVDVTVIFVFFIFFQIPIKLYEPIMISSDKISEFVSINLFFNATFFFAVGIPLIVYESTSAIFYSLIVFFIIQYLVIYTSIFKAFTSFNDESTDESDESSFASQLKYSFPIGMSGAISEISRIVDKVIVSNNFTPGQLAIYARGAIEIPMLNVIINSLGNILMPKFIKAYNENKIDEIIKYWHSSTIIIAFAVYPMMVLFISVADSMIPLLFSVKFLDSIIIFQVYSLSFLTRITTYDSIIRAVGATGRLLRVTIFSITINITLTILFVSYFGMVGAVFATIITIIIIRLEMLRIIKNLLKIKFTQVFPWLRLIKILFFSIISLTPVVFYKLFQVGHSYFTQFLLTSLLYGLTYWLVIRFFKVLNQDELLALEGVLPKSLINLISPNR